MERAAREKAKRGPAQQLASTLISLRNWQIGKPQLSIGQHVLLAALDTAAKAACVKPTNESA